MNLLNLQNATRLLTSAKNALDSFVFSNSSTSPSQLAIALRAEASLLVMPPEAATAMALLKSTLVFFRFLFLITHSRWIVTYLIMSQNFFGFLKQSCPWPTFFFLSENYNLYSTCFFRSKSISVTEVAFTPNNCVWSDQIFCCFGWARSSLQDICL